MQRHDSNPKAACCRPHKCCAEERLGPRLRPSVPTPAWPALPGLPPIQQLHETCSDLRLSRPLFKTPKQHYCAKW